MTDCSFRISPVFFYFKITCLINSNKLLHFQKFFSEKRILRKTFSPKDVFFDFLRNTFSSIFSEKRFLRKAFSCIFSEKRFLTLSPKHVFFDFLRKTFSGKNVFFESPRCRTVLVLISLFLSDWLKKLQYISFYNFLQETCSNELFLDS